MESSYPSVLKGAHSGMGSNTMPAITPLVTD